ncbi:metal-dependent phosphohydrolase HD sub domain-containing protein [Emticicia oligotrophica DSM 17448]|uniref:Metal-dependent phosphohydrolase HD sub domain-containing protein n=1 Tax=Emticicia oligotrophica (strain DSM 17448 / CIP 109782 / MTCC 6937 / GPTSA100-15) TaxID=929562 RepID=A0ABM5N4J4_EMTOG|nr:HD domain-containing protein [Emticicia oligotrophica]AFK04377.1 metal-dependent phosphohydrolase HD sub domain-containing protein [Emticicia oligotrophica DSM 17448]
MNKHLQVYKAAEKYMRVRKNDVHIPLSYKYALKLIEKYPNADADLAAISIILHDIGWYSIDEDDIFKKGFQSENFMQSDVRYLHESEGVRLSTELLKDLGYSEEFIQKVAAIIDGHDTRNFSKSLEDEIVRDADKLWRFTVTGVSVACDWFKQTPSRYCNRLETDIIPQLHLPESIEMAKADLAETRKELLCDVI